MAVAQDPKAALIAQILGSDELYAIMGVAKEVESVSLQKAYKKLALKLHPDKCSLDGATDAFKKVGSAFATLKDDNARAHYDRFGVSGLNQRGGGGGGGMPFTNHDDLFREMFRNDPRFSTGSGGGPGGMHFSFNGMDRDGGGGTAFRTLKMPTLPEPLATIVAMIPGPVWFLGFIWAFFYAASSIIGFMLRNLHVVVVLSYIPISRDKTAMWVAFFAAGVFGWL